MSKRKRTKQKKEEENKKKDKRNAMSRQSRKKNKSRKKKRHGQNGPADFDLSKKLGRGIRKRFVFMDRIDSLSVSCA